MRASNVRAANLFLKGCVIVTLSGRAGGQMRGSRNLSGPGLHFAGDPALT